MAVEVVCQMRGRGAAVAVVAVAGGKDGATIIDTSATVPEAATAEALEDRHPTHLVAAIEDRKATTICKAACHRVM